MNKKVRFVLPTDHVQTAAQRMRDEGVGFLPVCDEEGRVLGTLTDRDITLRIVAEGYPVTTTVREVMTTEVVCCRPQDDLRDAERVMADRRKSRIMCIDAGRLVGVISLSDIAARDDSRHAGETIKRVSERETRPS